MKCKKIALKKKFEVIEIPRETSRSHSPRARPFCGTVLGRNVPLKSFCGPPYISNFYVANFDC